MAGRVWGAAAIAGLLASPACTHRPPVSFDPSRLANPSCRESSASAEPVPTWIAPSDVNSRLQLSRWCDTVGPVFFQPRPAAEARAAATLAIVSWNVHEGGGDVDDLVRRLRGGEFTAGVPVDQFVLLLQEATRRENGVPVRVPRGYPAPRRIASRPGRPTGDIRRFAQEGYAVLYAPSMSNGEHEGSAEDRGNAIVSTLPLQGARLIELPLEHQRRVVVAAALQGWSVSGTPWHVELVNVHLDTALAFFHGGPFEARQRQAAALLDALHTFPAYRNDGTAVVIAGDLNTWMGSREPAATLLWNECSGTPVEDRSPTWTGPLGLHATLDHIFVCGRVSPGRVTRLPSRFGSDHYPLLTVVHF
jgi:endonuclease/exonuclease/phosphatase family metal-dependent hydrolase